MFYPPGFKGTICKENLCSLKTSFLAHQPGKAIDGFSQNHYKKTISWKAAKYGYNSPVSILHTP